MSGINIAHDVGTTGTMNITGAGSLIELKDDSIKAFATIGHSGNGSLNVTQGGKLLIDGTYSTVGTAGLAFGGDANSDPAGAGTGLVADSFLADEAMEQ